MSELLITPLNDLHIELGAKMVPFAGFSMPVQYPLGMVKEHLYTREKATVFDVSHMGQLIISGDNVDEALEKILPSDIKGLKAGRQRYSFFTLPNGGILDDLMIARIDDTTFYMVVNASRKDVDYPHLHEHLADFDVTELNEHALIALQGPLSSQVLEQLISGVATMRFMDSKVFDVDGVSIRVSRSGYSGEDGYEISLPQSIAIDFTKKLFALDNVQPAGLGARNSLRLECGLCLYGNELTEDINPVEADLLWAMQKARKKGGEREGGFIGADVILKKIESGANKKRVGFTVAGKLPVRDHTDVFDSQGNRVGEVTSGAFGATLDAPVAMGYVDIEHAGAGTNVIAKVRKKEISLTVVELPMVPQNYYRG